MSDYIERDVTLVVSGKTAKFNENVYIFKGDKDIQLNIEIIDTNMKYSRTNPNGNVLLPLPSNCYAKVGLLKPKGDQIIRERVPIIDNKVAFVIDESICDELEEIGIHKIQIQIWATNEETSPRWTLPSAAELEVLKPDINFQENQENQSNVSVAKVGVAKTNVTGLAQRPILNAEGLYNKKAWIDNEVITKEDLNVIEEGVYNNSAQLNNIANEFATEQIDNILKLKFKDKVIFEVPLTNTEIEENLPERVETPYLTGRTLLFEDDFEGTELDSTNWGYEIGYVRNDELQYYKQDNVAVKGSYLILTAKKEDCNGKTWTSGSVHSKGKKEFTYGRIEAKIMLPTTKGGFPAFWMLGKNCILTYKEDGSKADCAGYPACGEIDIMEQMGAGNPQSNLWNKLGQSIAVKYSQVSVGTDWHIYAMEWTKDYIEMFVDEKSLGKYDITGENLVDVYNLPFFAILNLAVGASGGTPADTTTEMKMYVDWVRVYEPVEEQQDTNNTLDVITSDVNLTPSDDIGLTITANAETNIITMNGSRTKPVYYNILKGTYGSMEATDEPFYQMQAGETAKLKGEVLNWGNTTTKNDGGIYIGFVYTSWNDKKQVCLQSATTTFEASYTTTGGYTIDSIFIYAGDTAELDNLQIRIDGLEITPA